MKEVDYVFVTNLASIKAALYCMREVMPIDGVITTGSIAGVRLKLSFLLDEQLALIAIDEEGE